ncbi:MAG TPA: molybdate ABC transporter permease subunit, partial [Longimicrobiales bacterium]|nr:molybdate ABC transporter permease subunit [Longimicrobiales bacterium]
LGYLPAESYGPAEVWAAPVRGSSHGSAVGFVDDLAAPSRVELIRAAGFLVPESQITGGPGAADSNAVPPAPASGEPRLGPVVVRSVLVGLLAVLLATLPALMLGRWLARTRSRARGPVGAVLLLPLVLPPVVTGFLLLAVFGSSGLLGPLLAQFGLRLSFSFWAAVVAAAVVGFPLYAVVVRNAFESVDPRYEELAWTLGARPRSTFLRVALPLALPGVAAGAVLALARGLGEFGATIVVAGNIEGETQTLALAVYRLLESPAGRGRIWLFVLASAVIAVLGLALWEWLTARQRARVLDGGGR